MVGLRRMVSLLLANGHPEAGDYRISTLWLESTLVIDRINQQTVTEAVLIQLAAGSIMSKKAGGEFAKAIKKMT